MQNCATCRECRVRHIQEGTQYICEEDPDIPAIMHTLPARCIAWAPRADAVQFDIESYLLGFVSTLEAYELGRESTQLIREQDVNWMRGHEAASREWKKISSYLVKRYY